jgi:hypothetical protein
MNFCPDCGSSIQSSTSNFCPECGKQINNILIPSEKDVNQGSFLPWLSRYKTVISFGLIGFLCLMVLLKIVINSSYKYERPVTSEQITSEQTPKLSRRIVGTGYYFNIGLTATELIKKIGQPTSIDQFLYVYENSGSRLMFGFKNNRVFDASYIIVGVRPIDVPVTISALMSDLEDNNFKRIGDKDNIMRYENGIYQLSILPGKTDDRSYNICLMVFHK